MRIHRLRVQAFGPFAEETEVDLDALSDAGLFLLTGATGAGKTSVLDAVCFALYGGVPGDRQIAKRLRSDHAAPGVAPEVSLELTLAGRRFVVDRSPAWERPKKRGTGTTLQQASVLVRERVDGVWVPRASRLDEAGHLLGGLLGMTQTQFCQVQMLPQGRFQTFLRSGSDERARLLHQLFRTSRFESVEAWLRDHRRALGRESARHQERVGDLLSRVSEAAGVDLPDSWDLHALAAVAPDVTGWADDVRAAADRDHEQARSRLVPAEVAEDEARAAVDRARTLLDRRARYLRASREREQLLEQAERHEVEVACLDAGRRAVAVLAHVEAAQREQRARDEARHLAERDLGRLRRSLGEAPTDDLGTLVRTAADTLATARASLPRDAELADLAREVEDGRRHLDGLDEEVSGLVDEAERLPRDLSAAVEAEQEARRAADSLPAAEREVELVRARLEAGLEVVELVRTRAEAADLLRVAVDDSQARREAWLELQERRLSGMAAEIAVGLASGDDCPVCGSLDHPHPARPHPDAPDAEAVRQARSAVDDAEVVRHARELALAELDARLTAARDRADHATVPVLRREVDDRERRLARLGDRAATLAGKEAARAELELRLSAVRARLHVAHGEQSSRAAALASREERLTELRSEVTGLLAGTDHTTIASLVTALAEVARRATAAHDSENEARRCAVAVDAARDRAAAAAAERGFRDVSEAVAAATAAGDLADLQQRVDDRRQRRAAVESVLAEPELQAAAEAEQPDLTALETTLAVREQELRAARDAEGTHRRRTERLAGLLAQLASALAAWAPVRERHVLADRMATLADGSSPDNRLRMRLSGYVLAARLAQVVAAANERLGTMLDGRYRLEHSDDRGAGETRGGLSLRVRDEWSGESRDPVTLSGGETFVVSLALALGLSDVISHEAGGAELDTLFVDEGFGTLDADSLDHVMDMLDTLRDGGRVVGVVSHVPELRDRIPAQLHVEKRRSGSTLRSGRERQPMR